METKIVVFLFFLGALCFYDQTYASAKSADKLDPMFLVTGKGFSVLARERSSSDSAARCQLLDDGAQRSRASSLLVLQNASTVAVAFNKFSKGPKEAVKKKGN